MSYDFAAVNVQTEERKPSPYLSYGSGQILKINSIELKFSQNTGSPKAILHMESKPVNEPGFTPVDGAKGRVGRISGSIYMKDDNSKRNFMNTLYIIAQALGLESEIKDISGETFQETIKKAEAIVCNGSYARYSIFAEEYAKPENKIGISLFLPKYKFVEAVDADPTTLVQFDKTQGWHYKKLKTPVGSEEPIDDLPF